MEGAVGLPLSAGDSETREAKAKKDKRAGLGDRLGRENVRAKNCATAAYGA